MNERRWNLCILFRLSLSLLMAKWIEKTFFHIFECSRRQQLLPLWSFIKQQVKEFLFCLARSKKSSRAMENTQRQKRTRIMLMSLMISEMFHLLSAFFLLLISLPGRGANKIIQLINFQLLTTINKALYDEDKTFSFSFFAFLFHRFFVGTEKGTFKALLALPAEHL